LALYSEQFDNAGWTKFNASVTANDAVSPDGYTNADALVGNGTTSYHYIINTFASATSGTAYTASFFAKKGSVNFVQLVLDSSSFGVLHQNFDLLNGTIGSGSGSITPFIESYGNDWYRVGITVTATANLPIKPYIAIASSASMARFGSFATSGDIKIYGLQIEAGSYATSYIPTQGAISTRVADACSNENLNVDYSGDYTLYLEHEALSLTEYNQFQFRQETSISYITFRVGNSLNIGAGLYTAANTIGFNKFALSVTSIGSYKFYKNGVLLSSGSGLNANLETIKSDALGMNIKDLKLYNTALTDAELQALTTI
jgi:hypothetical protein